MDELFSHLPSAGNDNFQYERLLTSRGFYSIAGVDEVGRGPLAGPVVAACVILPPDISHSSFIDSKQLTPSKRLQLYSQLKDENCAIGIGVVEERVIEEINILQASLLAMKKAVDDVASKTRACDFLLVDGKFETPCPLPQQTLIKGESKSASIAAASIVAKVARDHMMLDFHEHYPQYNFARNKGYPTKEHRLAISRHGPCPIHRRTFKGVKEFV